MSLELFERAIAQKRIRAEDFARFSDQMQAQLIAEGVQPPGFDGVQPASLFKADETVLQRAELQGKLDREDFGKLSPAERAELHSRGIELAQGVPSVFVPSTVDISIEDFGYLTEAQRDDAMTTWNIKR